MQLSDYIKTDRSVTQRVADSVGFSRAFLAQIASGQRPCPAERAAQIEAACGGRVRRWDLRPTDWHLIWPELIGAEGAPPAPCEARDAA